MSISRTIGAIPPKARVMIISAVALSVGIAFYSANKIMSSGQNDPVGTSVQSTAKVDMRSAENIAKSMPGDTQIISDDSPMGMEIQQAREDDINKAKETRGSFIDKLELENNKTLVAEIDKELKADRTPNGLDDIRSSKIQMEQKRREDLINKRNAIADKSKESRPAIATATYFDEKAFMKEELRNVEKNSLDQAARIEKLIAEPSGRMSAYQMSSEGKAGNGGSNTNAKPSYQTASSDSYRDGSNSDYQSILTPDVSRYQKKHTAPTEYEKLVNPTGNYSGVEKEYVEAGTLNYALLQTSVDTDEISPVRAVIIQDGPLKGAVLIGTPVRVGEDVHINFHTMSLNKKDYTGINMVSYNPDTGRAGLADSVDRHIFERYFKLIASSAVEGYAAALSGTTTRTYSDGSVEKTTSSLPNAKDQAAVAIGKVGEKLSPVFEKEFDRPPTVYVDQKPIGIMLMTGIEIQ